MRLKLSEARRCALATRPVKMLFKNQSAGAAATTRANNTQS